MFTNYQEMYYSAKSMGIIVRKRLDIVHMHLNVDLNQQQDSIIRIGI